MVPRVGVRPDPTQREERPHVRPLRATAVVPRPDASAVSPSAVVVHSSKALAPTRAPLARASRLVAPPAQVARSREGVAARSTQVPARRDAPHVSPAPKAPWAERSLRTVSPLTPRAAQGALSTEDRPLSPTQATISAERLPISAGQVALSAAQAPITREPRPPSSTASLSSPAGPSGSTEMPMRSLPQRLISGPRGPKTKNSSARHFRQDSLEELRLPQSRARSHQVLDLGHELVEVGVPRGGAREGGAEAKTGREVGRPFAHGSRIDEVGHRCERPGRVDDRGHLFEEGSPDRLDGLAGVRRRREHVSERERLEGRDGHPLTEHWIEPADRVADGQETARKRGDALEVPQAALEEAKPIDARDHLRGADRVGDRPRPQGRGVLAEACLVTRWMIIVPATEGEHPPVALDGEQQPVAAGPGGVRQVNDPLPAARGIGRNIEDGARVPDIDAYRRLGHAGRPRVARRAQRRERELPGARRVDDELGAPRLRPAPALAPDSADRLFVGRAHRPEDAAAGLEADVAEGLDAAAHAELELRARDSVRVEAEISLDEGIEAGPLDPEVEPLRQSRGACLVEVVDHSGKQLVERAMSAGKERVQLLALGHARPWHGGRIGSLVA